MNHVLISQQEKLLGTLAKIDPRSQHILSVLKLQEGDTLRMGVLNESRGTAQLVSITPDGIHFVYQAQQDAEQPLPITLLIGGTRPLVMQRILRDATAFGVQQFIVVHTKNSEQSYLQCRLWHNNAYRSYVYDGLSLAKAVTEPHVHRCFSLTSALGMVHTDCRLLAEAQTNKHLGQCPITTPLTLVIGPERGFTPDELELFKKNGFTLGHLGQRIVRTETACFLALSLVGLHMALSN